MPFMVWPMIDEVEFPVKEHIRIRVVFYRFNFSFYFFLILLESSTNCRRLLSLGVYFGKLC